MKKVMMLGMLATGLFLASCSENPSTMPEDNAMRAGENSTSTSPWNPDAANVMDLYYNGSMVSAFSRTSVLNGSALHQHQSANKLYRYMADSVYNANHELQVFMPVTNMYDNAEKKLWRETMIVFNRGFEPHQFTSAAAIEAAATGNDPEIILVPGTHVYTLQPVSGH